VIGAQWSEIDLKAKVWTVTASRMKSGKEHRVPLSDRAVALLQALPREADYVFPGGRQGVPISNMGMTTVLRRMKRGDFTVHGFRSTFRDWAAERSNYPNHVVEMALAHVIGDKVEAAYRRGDLFAKRTRLMAEWSKFCMTKPAATASNITPLRRAQ
jgi:integrase